MNPTLSIIVPCYNEEKNVCKFYQLCELTMQEQSLSHEYIFVNDGSTDETLKELKKLYDKDTKQINVIGFSRNFGKESAIFAGLEASKGDYVVLIDADLQQHPKYAVEMLKFLEENKETYDSVAAYQEIRKEDRKLIFFKNIFYKLINKISDVEFVKGASDFRVLKKSMVMAILEMKEYYRFSKGIFSWIGFETYYMSYQVEERMEGVSSWSFWKLFKYAIDGIVSFTTTPLRISMFLGFLLSICSFLYLLVIVIQKVFFSIAVPGYPTLVVLILLLGGVQLLSIGIIGEYLARTYVEVKNRPIYIVKTKMDAEG